MGLEALRGCLQEKLCRADDSDFSTRPENGGRIFNYCYSSLVWNVSCIDWKSSTMAKATRQFGICFSRNLPNKGDCCWTPLLSETYPLRNTGMPSRDFVFMAVIPNLRPSGNQLITNWALRFLAHDTSSRPVTMGRSSPKLTVCSRSALIPMATRNSLTDSARRSPRAIL